MITLALIAFLKSEIKVTQEIEICNLPLNWKAWILEKENYSKGYLKICTY